jgi:hypothetical protein
MKCNVAHAVASVLAIAAAAAQAGATDVLSELVGYTVIASKTIDSFADRGKEKKDGFEGCDYDRVIIFTDGTAVTCRTYSYTYSYRPTAIILGQQVTYQGKQLTLLKMVVGDTVYDMAGR